MIDETIEYNEKHLRDLKRYGGWIDATITAVIGEGLTFEESLKDAQDKMRSFLKENNYQVIVRPLIKTNQNGNGFYTCLEATLFRIVE